MRIREVSTLRKAICALVTGAVTAAVPMAAAAWEPTKPVQFIVPAGTGGGADQMARFIQGVVSKHHLMKEPMIVVNESGGAGAQGFLDVKGAKGDPEHDRHHAVEPVHDADGDRRAVQLARPDAGGDAGARRVRAVGQRGHAVQDREGLHRRDQGGGSQQIQDGRHRLEAGRPDHHGRDRAGQAGRQVHLHPAQGRRRRRRAAGRQARRFHGQQSDRGGCAMARRPAAPAVRVRFDSGCRTRRRSPKTCRGTTSRRARKPGCRSST